MMTAGAAVAVGLLCLLVPDVLALNPCSEWLNQLEARVAKVERHIQFNSGHAVAFGAVLGDVGNIGPFNAEITLVYGTVLANTGEYNAATGIFTAPIKGYYYFNFSGHNIATRAMGLRLMKNGQQMITVYNHIGGQRPETATNGITLLLNARDQVYMRLRANTWIFDNVNYHSSFTGFLLFPVAE